MNNKIYILAFILSSVLLNANAQDYYWVEFTNKNNTEYSLSTPEEYLSNRAIQRRINQNIPIDSLDLPVNASYVNQIIRPGVNLIHSSKWLNGITIAVFLNGFTSVLSQMPFVKDFQVSKPRYLTKSAKNKFLISEFKDDDLSIDTSYYGNSIYQVSLLNGQYLHNKGYKGEGIVIAILDNGFIGVERFWWGGENLPAFDSLLANKQLLGFKDYVKLKSNSSYLGGLHGMNVLSCIGGNIPGELIGTAPKASFWLLRSEDGSSEFLIEEDNWIAAAEFADSVGADIINSSLGYTEFDDEKMNHTYADMDGKTTRVTRGANIAFSRGMLVFSGAGNEGERPWKYIIAPADGDNVIGVGAVNRDGTPALWTSRGPASDLDVKPNVAALGWGTFLQDNNGLAYLSGTSFSSPIMAGMGACLWQANPQATALEVKLAIEKSAHQYSNPDNWVGYGIPDMELADQLLEFTSAKKIELQNNWLVYPNPLKDIITIQKNGQTVFGEVNISIYSIDGRILYNKTVAETDRIVINDLHSLPVGLLILKLISGNIVEAFLLNKM